MKFVGPLRTFIFLVISILDRYALAHLSGTVECKFVKLNNGKLVKGYRVIHLGIDVQCFQTCGKDYGPAGCLDCCSPEKEKEGVIKEPEGGLSPGEMAAIIISATLTLIGILILVWKRRNVMAYVSGFHVVRSTMSRHRQSDLEMMMMSNSDGNNQHQANTSDYNNSPEKHQIDMSGTGDRGTDDIGGTSGTDSVGDTGGGCDVRGASGSGGTSDTREAHDTKHQSNLEKVIKYGVQEEGCRQGTSGYVQSCGKCGICDAKVP